MPYNAFISYSHAADAPIAAALQSALHRFAKPWYKLRALHVFRDQTNLAVSPALWSSIREALDQSLYYILFASPEDAASPWVAKEADYWVSRNGTSHLLLVLTGGTLQWDRAAGAFTPESATALPPNLLRAFSEEPLYLDLRWARESGATFRLREPRFHEAVLQLASTLHNKPKDELDGADIRTQRHARWLAVSVAAVILGIGLFAWRQTGANRIISTENTAAALAADSNKVLADSADRAVEAALLAVESTRLDSSFEGAQALRAAAALLPAAAQFYPPQDSDPAQRIRDMALSPDGATLAVARDDGSTQLIDIANRKAIGYIGPDEQPAARIQIPGVIADSTSNNDSAVSEAFNTAGNMLAAADRDGVAHVWTLPEGREVLRIVDTAPLSQVAFRPGANEVLAAGDDGHVRLFDVSRASTLADFECPEKVVAAAFTPDGGLIAALSSFGAVCVFDLAQHKIVRTLSGSGEAAFNLSFSRDGKRVAAADGDYALVWDVSTGKQLLKATHAASSETLIPQRWIVDAAISPDGKLMAYAARGDKSVHVWNIETGRQVLELKHDSAAAAVAFNADGTRLGTGSYDGTARVWELPSGNELERVSHGGGAEVVMFTSDGRFTAGGMDGSVSVSGTSRADRPAFFAVPADVRAVAFSPDGARVAIGTVSTHFSPLVRIADLAGNTVRDIEFHGAPVIDRLFFLSPSQVIAQWSDKLFLIGVDGSVTPMSDLPGDKHIEPSGQVMAIERNGVTNLYALPGRQQTASVTVPKSTLLRPVAGGKFVAFEIDEPPNKSAVEIWSTESKSRVCRISLPGELNRIAFDKPGSAAFTAESEKFQAWEIPSGRERFHLTASDDIQTIVPSPSSDAVATIAHGRLTLWETSKGARVGQIPDTGGYIRAAAFSSDGRYLLTGYDERSAALWLWRAGDLRDQACARLSRNFTREEWAQWFPHQPYRQTCPNLPAAK